MENVSEILNNLRSEHAEIRRFTIESLLNTPLSVELTKAIAEMVADEDRGVRDAASQLAIANPTKALASAILNLITNKNVTIRNLAGETLVKMGEVSVNEIAKYITDDDKDTRKFAIDLLTLLPAHHHLDQIVHALSDKDQNVVLSAIDAITALNGEVFAPQLINIYNSCEFARVNVIEALSQFKGDYAAFFANALTDFDPVVQLLGLEALCDTDAETTLPLLFERLSYVNNAVKALMLKEVVDIITAQPELQKLVPNSTKTDFMNMLDDPDDEMVLAAVKGLGYFSDTDIVDAFIAKMGINETLDMAIYQGLSKLPVNVIPKILEASNDLISLQTAARFGLGLLAKYLQTDEKVVSGKSTKKFSEFILKQYHFLELDAKLTAVQLYTNFNLPLKQEILAVASDVDENFVINENNHEIAHS